MHGSRMTLTAFLPDTAPFAFALVRVFERQVTIRAIDNISKYTYLDARLAACHCKTAVWTELLDSAMT